MVCKLCEVNEVEFWFGNWCKSCRKIKHYLNLYGDRVYYNKFSKALYTATGFNKWLSEITKESIDIFDQPLDLTSNTKVALQNVLRGIEIKETDTLEFVFKKILTGDNGDNVSSLHQFVKTNSDNKTRVYRITETKAIKILNAYKDKYGSLTEETFFNKESMQSICQITKDILRIVDKTVPQLMQKFEANRNLMYLHNSALPPSIMNAMLESIENSKHSTIRNLAEINKQNITKPMLNNEKNLTTTNEASFFGGIKFE